jgi:hypothetical protein
VLVTHIAGFVGVSNRRAMRCTPQPWEGMLQAQMKTPPQPKARIQAKCRKVKNDEGWYVLLSNGVDLGMCNKMRSLNVKLGL